MTDTKTTHTPGPWSYACDSYGKVRHSKKACVYTNVRESGGERLVGIAGRIPSWKDAALIAAAPDLLAACEAMLNVSSLMSKADDMDGARAVRIEVYEQARAAIARARGETP